MTPNTSLNTKAAAIMPAVEATCPEPPENEANDAENIEEPEMEEVDTNGLYGVNYICPLM